MTSYLSSSLRTNTLILVLESLMESEKDVQKHSIAEHQGIVKKGTLNSIVALVYVVFLMYATLFDEHMVLEML